MLRPRIKHKVSEIEEKSNISSKKSLVFFLLLILILFIGGSVLNNYLNKSFFNSSDEVNYKGLNFKLLTDKDSYTQGERITIKLVISNKTKNRVDIDFLTPELAYFTVYTYVNLGLTRFYYRVWTTKPDIPPPVNVYRLSLKPGESLSIVKVWDQVDMNGNPVKTGKYKFVVELNVLEKVSLNK